jgi:hypothetical protein
MWQHFQNLNLNIHVTNSPKRRYSITADILAYERCSIQYGAFAVRKYEPALVVQLFYGTVIHQVLDRAHAHYRGEIGPLQPGSLPTDQDIDNYFQEVENALIARRIRAVQSVRDQALMILQRFNSLEGPSLYPRVIDTECRLQADQQSYILHGNVDVLATTEASTPANPLVEIWDYKGAYKPSLNDPDYQRYVYQMQVYSELYRRKTGQTPARAVLYFLNELGGEPGPQTRPINALMSVSLDPNEVQAAMHAFQATVQSIENCRTTRIWPYPIVPPPQETCSACDLRWNCQATAGFGRQFPIIYP